MVDPRLKEILVCPACQGALAYDEQSVTCTACTQVFPVDGHIPMMVSSLSADGFGHDLYNAQLRGNFFEKVFHTNRIQTLMRLITSELNIEPGCKALDVGCNTGPMLIPLRRAGYDVVGIDISAHDVHQAERYLDQCSLPSSMLAVADGTQLPFRDCSFDFILLIDILEHTAFPELIVAQARRLLSPGGTVIATVPWNYHPYVHYDIFRRLLSSRKTIDEHPDAPFTLAMLQALFPDFEPVLFRLVFHWVCILGVYHLPSLELAA
jgi:ubiquinone/menaquinone biosynthesis C-methylase UbiE/uncharacterized protein YbaR (Trm112 family)